MTSCFCEGPSTSECGADLRRESSVALLGSVAGSGLPSEERRGPGSEVGAPGVGAETKSL